ncbi:flexible cuticle protein 12-like [Anoplophora glabripennis]|uniref:flexible cuticle protein 12-like n=1 Tax=Anoplophora glabripennis TaxID=217634 RepID=UPI000875A5DF|nr:flexible cuticle protein 12-like [Anoplophora glabripennis]
MIASGITSVVITFNMKMILFLCACLNSVYAQPQNPVQVEVIKNKFELTDTGGFSFSFSTSDGIHHEATGEMKNIGTPEEALAVKGVYSYIAPDGTAYEVEYTADDKGFRPHVKILPPSVLRIASACEGSLCGTGLG